MNNAQVSALFCINITEISILKGKDQKSFFYLRTESLMDLNLMSY